MRRKGQIAVISASKDDFLDYMKYSWNDYICIVEPINALGQSFSKIEWTIKGKRLSEFQQLYNLCKLRIK